MASLQSHLQLLQFRCSLSPLSPKLPLIRKPNLSRIFPPHFRGKLRHFAFRETGKDGDKVYSICCFPRTGSEIESTSNQEQDQRPPFDINLAVILAGFAFEAYTTPPDSIGRREVDAADCKTVYLSEAFVREIYDGQLFVKLKKGFNLPAMDPWGTSDPYVVIQMDSQTAKSKIKWGTKEPTWNEEFTFNIKQPPTKPLQVAAWDANLVTPHKRMGNAGINLEYLCDGDLHELEEELEGMGGGGKVQLEVQYKTFEEIDDEKKWWKIPFVSEFLKINGIDSALRKVTGSDTVQARQFVEYAFGQLKSFHNSNIKDQSSDIDNTKGSEKWDDSSIVLDMPSQEAGSLQAPIHQAHGDMGNEHASEPSAQTGKEEQSEPSARQFMEYAFGQLKSFHNSNIKDQSSDIDNTKGSEKWDDSSIVVDMPSQEAGSLEAPIHQAHGDMGNEHASEPSAQAGKEEQSDQLFWRNFANIMNQNIVQKLGVSVPEKLKWDGFDILNKIGSQSRKVAEAAYIESGLAIPGSTDGTYDKASDQPALAAIQSSVPEVKKASENLLRQTDSILGALMLLAATVSKMNKDGLSGEKREINEDSSPKVGDGDLLYSTSEKFPSSQNGSLDKKKTEEMRKLFSTAESAMEAWAMLATSLGHPSFIKSEFEKICFLDNTSTDTQVAIWRDSVRRRLVVAFRGTEQARWKDLRTDLMLVPAGLNPERIGGDFKQEVQVHSGFLSAYDSVRTRIISLIRLAIGYKDDNSEPLHKWHVYVTGHSLGGALATLLALELSSNQLAKWGAISVTMYNFGSPRVGNKRFAEVYNAKVKDSWRVVNHRDIIPTVPRLMGYCHVAQPVYLAAGDLKLALENMERDGYQGDVIGESTPDVLVSEFMKGEKELVEKLLQTEINIFRAIRDGSALMQHMEDFYYITLLENVKSNYQAISRY